MKTFFDANVLLEVLLPDRVKAMDALKAIQNSTTQLISPLTVHLYVHFGRREGFSLQQLLAEIQKFAVTGMGKEQVAWAIQNHPGNDFEDALQVACALIHGCDKFVTLDSRIAKQYQKFIEVVVL